MRTLRVLGVLSLAAGLAGCAAWFPPPQTQALRAQWGVHAGSPWSAPAAPAAPGVQGAAPGFQSAAHVAASGAHAIPPAVEWTEVPFHPQAPLHCGPASLAMVMQADGLETSPEALAERIYLPGRGGTLAEDMLTGTRREGGLAVRLPPSLPALLETVSQGRPVVVLQNLGLSWSPRWHYAVVIGHDLVRERVILRSGPVRRLEMPLDLFERTWARADHWAMVALRPSVQMRLPAAVTREDALQAAVGLERVAPPASAVLAYQAVLARWPDDEAAAFGLGNSLHAAGDLQAAANVLEPLARRSNRAAVWNNLAMVQLALGQKPAAREAAQRALARAQAFEPALVGAVEETLRALH